MSTRRLSPTAGSFQSPFNWTSVSSRASRFEWILTFVSIVIIISSPFIVGDQPTGAASLNPVQMLTEVSVGGDPSKQILLLAVYAACGTALLLTERPRAWLFIGFPLGLLLLLTFCSAIWSVNPEVTLRRSVALSGAVIIGIYIGLRLSVRQIIQLVFAAGIFVMVFSLVLAIIAPLKGTDFEHRLRGVCSDKNHFAEVCALTFVTALALTGMGRGNRWEVTLRVFGCLLAIICMAMARSTAVMPVLGACLGALIAGHILLRASPKLLAIIPLICCLFAVTLLIGIANSGAIAEFLGKDADMSGRTLIWAFSFQHIALRPWVGWGFSAFWTGGDSPGAVFWAVSHLGVPHAHNGFIQLALDVGLLGVALFLTCVLLTAMKVLWMALRLNQSATPWAFCFISLYFVVNYSEALLWTGNEPLLVLFITLVVRTNVDYRRYSIPLSPKGSAMAEAFQ